MGHCTGLERLGELVTPYTRLSVHTPQPPLVLPSRATTLEGSPDLVPRKATNALLRLFVGKGKKNYLILGAASTEIGRPCQQRHAGYVKTAVQEVGLGGEKNFGDKAIDR